MVYRVANNHLPTCKCEQFYLWAPQSKDLIAHITSKNLLDFSGTRPGFGFTFKHTLLPMKHFKESDCSLDQRHTKSRDEIHNVVPNPVEKRKAYRFC